MEKTKIVNLINISLSQVRLPYYDAKIKDDCFNEAYVTCLEEIQKCHKKKVTPNTKLLVFKMREAIYDLLNHTYSHCEELITDPPTKSENIDLSFDITILLKYLSKDDRQFLIDYYGLNGKDQVIISKMQSKYKMNLVTIITKRD